MLKFEKKDRDVEDLDDLDLSACVPMSMSSIPPSIPEKEIKSCFEPKVATQRHTKGVEEKSIPLDLSWVKAWAPKTAASHAYELVISHMDENLNWLNSFLDSQTLKPGRIVIYHKGKPLKECSAPYYNLVPVDGIPIQWIERPNLGRDGENILYHCLCILESHASFNAKSEEKKRQELEKSYVVFIQADHLSHVQKKEAFSDLSRYLASNTYTTSNTGEQVQQKFVGVQGNQAPVLEYSHLMQQQKTKHLLAHSALSLTEYYEFILDRPFPKQNIKVTWCNTFGVPITHILQHPKEFYLSIQQTVNGHSNPETGHFLERLMYSILGFVS